MEAGGLVQLLLGEVVEAAAVSQALGHRVGLAPVPRAVRGRRVVVADQLGTAGARRASLPVILLGLLQKILTETITS